jgi:hypothetical protein
MIDSEPKGLCPRKEVCDEVRDEMAVKY